MGFNPGEMLIGLGMAETTPDPLPDGLSPLMTATLAGLLVTWVTFTPCFLWVLLGLAPYVEAPCPTWIMHTLLACSLAGVALQLAFGVAS